MKNFVHNMFIEHPKSVDETYFEHLRFASSFALGLFIAGSAAIIHAIYLAYVRKPQAIKLRNFIAKLKIADIYFPYAFAKWDKYQ